jgi:hypothetical protein
VLQDLVVLIGLLVVVEEEDGMVLLVELVEVRVVLMQEQVMVVLHKSLAMVLMQYKTQVLEVEVEVKIQIHSVQEVQVVLESSSSPTHHKYSKNSQ